VVVRTAAKEHDIWWYMDLGLEETKELTEPSYPSSRSVNCTKTLYNEISENVSNKPLDHKRYRGYLVEDFMVYYVLYSLTRQNEKAEYVSATYQ
jgi:hypothetical protein